MIKACGQPRWLGGAACGGNLIQQPTSPAISSRLTSRHRCPTCAIGPRAIGVASIAGGLHAPAPRSLVRPRAGRSARRSAPGRGPDGPGSRTRSQPGGSPAPEAPDGGWHRGPGGRHSSAAHPGRQSGPRMPTGSKHPPVVYCRPPGRPPWCAAPRSDSLPVSPRRTRGALMAVLTWHDIPPAVHPPQHRPGHGLPQELQAPKPPSAHRKSATMESLRSGRNRAVATRGLGRVEGLVGPLE
jgi:hypothetical protein